TVLIVELPTPPLPVIQRNADTLYTNTDYQSVWYLNGNPIPGATDWFYVPDSSAYYKVLQTDTSSGCNHMSLIYPFEFCSDILIATISNVPNPDTICSGQEI